MAAVAITDDDNENHSSTALEIEQDDENIERIHERQTLLKQGRRKIRSPGCKTTICKALIICLAAVVFILMLVEVWNDYGTYVTTRSLRPTLYSMSEFCPGNKTGIMTKNYNAPDCTYTTSKRSLKCLLELPTNHYIETCRRHRAEILLNISKGFYVVFDHNHTDCTTIKIWNI